MGRYLVLVKANDRSEAGDLPSEAMMQAMGAFNQAMIEAGALDDGGGLQPTSSGARIKFSKGEVKVTSGPFKSNDLVSGFWIIEADSNEDAITWMQRAPFGAFDQDTEIEIRKILGPEDFDDETE